MNYENEELNQNDLLDEYKFQPIPDLEYFIQIMKQ
jgi:hypothetical protein